MQQFDISYNSQTDHYRVELTITEADAGVLYYDVFDIDAPE